MKFIPEVSAALQTLRDNAENDFERHRIDVLERDLTAPPTVEQVDDTHQRFNGIIYCKSKNKGHFESSNGIHRAVYEYFVGNIPEGYHIHHIDMNKSNNNISNLQCLTKAEHRKIHVELAKKNTTCIYCGKEFVVGDRSDNNGYCSSTCRIAHKYRLAENQVIRICQNCGGEFVAYKHSRKKCCSVSCGQQMRFKGHSEKRICPVCGKEFKTIASRDNICCSHSCGSKLMWQTKRTNDRKEIRQCLNCGKPFPVNKSTQQFCSKSCAMKHRYRKIAASASK